MVSVVFVELVGDNGEAPSKMAGVSEEVECIASRDFAARVGEKDIFGVKVKLSHVVSVHFLVCHEVYTKGLGSWGHSNLYKFRRSEKNANIILLRVFLLGSTMPRRNTKSSTKIRHTKNQSIPFISLAPGVTKCRNHLIIDASVPENPLETAEAKDSRLQQQAGEEGPVKDDEIGGPEGSDRIIGS